MRKMVCIAAGAAAILLAAAPVAAQRSSLVASSGASHSRAGAAGQPGFVRGRPCHGQNHRCFGNRFGRGRGFGLFAYGYGGLVEDPESLRDQGFFADTGGSRQENGRAVYDYDRGYPYDWYREPAAEAAPVRSGPPMVHCELDWVAGARGARSAVRVCRGRR